MMALAGGMTAEAVAQSASAFAASKNGKIVHAPTLQSARTQELDDDTSVYVEKFEDSSRPAFALYQRCSAEPHHPMKFQNAGRWWSIDEPAVTPLMAGARFDGETDDTNAWKSVLALNRAVFFPPGTSRITAQLANGPFHIFGTPTDGVSSRPSVATLLVDGPGVTPLASSSQITATDFAIEYQSRAKLPGTGLIYARALVVEGSIETIGSELRLTIHDAQHTSPLTVGSAIVAVAEVSQGTHDFRANAYRDFDDIFIISEVLSTQTARLIGRRGTNIQRGTLHIRGNCFASVWKASQPTGIRIERIRSTFCPGYTVMLTGAQQVDINRVYGGGHLGTVGAWPHNGRAFNTGGNYHHVRLEGLMNFAASGGVVHASGLNDSSVRQCQYDPNGSDWGGAINAHFVSSIAPYAFFSSPSLEFVGNSDEDHRGSTGAYFFNCEFLTVDKRHSYDITGPANTYDTCSYLLEGSVRVNPSSILKRTYRHCDNRSAQETLRLAGGRDQAGLDVWRAGIFPTFTRFQTTRDMEIKRFVLSQERIRSSSDKQMFWTIPKSAFSGWAGVGLNLITSVLFAHSAQWASDVSAPTVDLGTISIPTLFGAKLSLSTPADHYLVGNNIPNFRPLAFSESKNTQDGLALTLNFAVGPQFDKSLLCTDIALYISIQRYRYDAPDPT
ncbi:hypothetical protein [Bradyrhizobium elkanii]|uniref:hypothetical protein n=1 Tax=Bradyrhizobium elkanii TaxID=29448 RepID=UPI0018AD357A|nr:hypothetical protein [Bradyrhizobium elkanii]